ncbi:hypothetical protein [Saccharopolyspora taberi]|uniref:Cellulase family glycosylhydrolase n=1 Tax=Saccharopolyspora taberi TaxID=60895 RepID=A0ABN3VCN9_9PSEU
MPLNRRTLLGATAAATALPWTTGAPATRRRVRLGVNYTPSTRWFHMWEDFRADDLRRDLDDIAALGLDHVRLLLLWPAFQPEPNLVSGHRLDLLERFLDLADAAGLDVEVTVFNGHISARYWTPNWLQTQPKPANWFTDPTAIEAQRRLLRAIAARVAEHRRFLGFDLSNEVYYYWDDYAGLDVSPEQADAWLRSLAEVCEQTAPGKINTKGCDSAPWDAKGTNLFGRQALASAGSVTSIHPWTAFKGILRTDPLGPRATHNAERLVQVMQAYSPAVDRPVWVEEDGAAPSIHFSDQTRPLLGEWIERSVRNVAAGDHVFGFSWWCSHDVSEALVPGLNPLEYDLGLYTNDRELKPAGAALRKLAEDFDRDPPPVEPWSTGIVVPDDDPGRGAELFFSLASDGVRAAFVLSSRADDADHLRARGITELVRP